MTGTELQVAAMLMTTVTLALVIVITGLRRRWVRHQVRAEITRSHFAAIRNDLWDMAQAGGIDPESITFGLVHAVATHVLRSPDRYEQIALRLGEIVARRMRGEKRRADEVCTPFEGEQATWSPEVRALVMRCELGMFMLARDYSLAFRLLEATLKWAHARGWKPAAEPAQQAERFVEPRSRTVQQFRSVRNVFRTAALAAGVAAAAVGAPEVPAKRPTGSADRPNHASRDT